MNILVEAIHWPIGCSVEQNHLNLILFSENWDENKLNLRKIFFRFNVNFKDFDVKNGRRFLILIF